MFRARGEVEGEWRVELGGREEARREVEEEEESDFLQPSNLFIKLFLDFRDNFLQPPKRRRCASELHYKYRLQDIFWSCHGNYPRLV